MATYTTTDLIASIKANASIPTSQNLFQAADFLRFANHEMQINLVPLVMSAREEYFVADYNHSVTANQSSYQIPTRAIGGKLRDVQFISGTDISSLPRLEPELISSTVNGREGFYLQANNVVLSPTPTVTDGTLRLKHFRRPGTLVATSACGQITDIDSGTNSVTISSTPSTFTTGVEVDFIRNKPGFDSLAIDQAISGVSGTTISFSSLPSDLAVGDWIALATESPIPQLPVELHPVLAQAVAVKCILAQGKKAEAEQMRLKEMKEAALLLLTPRIDGEPRKITNQYGLLNHFRRGW